MNGKRMFAGLVVLAGWFGLVHFSAADDEKKEGGDKHFMKKASAAGLAEVNLSNLAVRRASDPAVREFAQRMIDNHMRLNQELLNLANKQQLTAARTMDDKHSKLLDKLAKLEGAEFDREYMDAIVKDHEEAVKLFEKESKEGQDETLKSMAGKLLPTLKEHLKIARDIRKKEKGETSKSGR
jgi:putative membrane protein